MPLRVRRTEEVTPGQPVYPSRFARSTRGARLSREGGPVGTG